MSRQLFVLFGDEMRRRAVEAVARAAPESRVTVQGPKRTLPQNARFWAMLTDISEQYEHLGRKYEPDAWKAIILHELGQELRFVPELSGKGFIPLGLSSRDLSVAEMSEAVEFMFAWGAEHGIVWSEPQKGAPTAPIENATQ